MTELEPQDKPALGFTCTFIERCPNTLCKNQHPKTVTNSMEYYEEQTYVCCKKCGVRGPCNLIGDRSMALDAWNRLPRIGPLALESTIEWHKAHGQYTEYTDDDGNTVQTISGGV